MKAWRVLVSLEGREWAYVLFSTNARKTSLAWRARGARVRVQQVAL